jgi:hypothetical protein
MTKWFLSITYFINYHNLYTTECHRVLFYYIQKSPRSCYDNLNKKEKANLQIRKYSFIHSFYF